MSMRTFDAASYASQSDYPSTQATDDSVSVFDRYSSFDGTFNLTRDLRVEGQVKGNITCQGTLFVTQGATVTATVDAENITVAGELDGDVTCRGKLQILSTGKVRGKLTTATLVINEGAVYEGELVMESGRQGNTRDSVRPRATATTSAPTAEPARSAEAAAPASSGSTGTAASGNTFIRRFGGQETTWDTTDTPSDDTEGSSF